MSTVLILMRLPSMALTQIQLLQSLLRETASALCQCRSLGHKQMRKSEVGLVGHPFPDEAGSRESHFLSSQRVLHETNSCCPVGAPSMSYVMNLPAKHVPSLQMHALFGDVLVMPLPARRSLNLLPRHLPPSSQM